MPDAADVAELFLVRGGGATAGLVLADATSKVARDTLQIAPPGPGNYLGLAVGGIVKTGFGIAAAAGADAIRGQHKYFAEGLDYFAAGAIVGVFLDVLRVLGVAPMGYGSMGHVQPAILPQQYYGPSPTTGASGTSMYYPQGVGAAGAAYGAAATFPAFPAASIPAGRVGQVAGPPTTIQKRPGQVVAPQYPRIMVS